MALDTESKNKILLHLCHAPTSIVVGHRNFNSIIRDRLEDITDEISDLVEENLTCVCEANDAIKKAVKCLKVSSVADVTMNKDHVQDSKDEYRRLVKQLSCLVDIPKCRSGNEGINIIV